MKWYSLKKYKPMRNIDCLIMTEYGAIEVAEFEGGFRRPRC
jgi:hypothetical protein